MKRRLFNLVAGLSLLLCVATVTMWMRSHSVGDYLISIRYFTHVDPKWMLVEGFDSDAGDLIITGNFTQCLTEDEVRRGTNSDFGDLAIDRGKFPAARTSYWVWRTHDATIYAHTPKTLLNRLGFYSVWNFGYKNPSWEHKVFIPFSLFTISFGIVPTMLALRFCLRRIRRSRAKGRATRGLCTACGYDLRGTPDQCPECGEVPNTVRIKQR